MFLGGDLMNKYGLKNRTRISNAVDTDLYNKLMDLSKKTMVPVSKLLDKSIELLLNEYSNENKK
jgi:hypothetical protein